MILVTGSSGQLGSELKEQLEEDSLFLSRNELDITDMNFVCSFIKEHHIDFIINCAAYTMVDKAEEERSKAHMINVIGTQNLAQTGIPIIHFSTDYVFDGKKNNPYVETDKTNPINLYGKTKLESERIVFENAETAIIIRTSWLYSKKYGNNFFKTMLKLGSEKEYINVVADQIGSPTNAADLASVIVDVIPKISSGMKEIYHFSSDGLCSWYEFAKEIMNLAGLKCCIAPIESKDYNCAAKRPMYSVLDKNKIKRDFKLQISNWIDSLIR